MKTPKGKITIGELSQECVDDLASLGDVKIDKTQIKNSLIETETGNVLDAVQGKVLDGKIIDLSISNLTVDKVECAFKPKTYQLKGQMHCHTTTSDGAMTPTDLLTRYKNAGYDFVAITDHDELNLNVDVDGILHIRSTEFLQGGNKSHLCAYDITKMRDLTEIMASQQGVIDFARANGGLVSIAHPKMSTIGTKTEEATNLEEYSFVEVCTGFSGAEYDDYIDVLLTNGKKINLLSVDDYHNDTSNTFNYGYIVVNCNTKNKDDIMTELKNGNYYSSTGNNISLSKSGNIITATSTSQSNFIFISNKGKTTINNNTSATYSIFGDETYVRVIAIRVSDGRKAWSNPIILKHVKKQANNNILNMKQFYKVFVPLTKRDSWFISSNFAGATVTGDGFGEVTVSSGSTTGGADCSLIYSVYNPNLVNQTHTFSGEIEKLTGNEDVEINVYASNGSETDLTCATNRLNKVRIIPLAVGNKHSFKIDFTIPYGYTGFCVIMRTKYVNNSFKIRNVSVSKFNRNISNDDMLLYKSFATSDELSVLSTDRGYLTSPRIMDNANNHFKNGKYFLNGGALNNPIGQSGYLDITSHDVNPHLFCVQRYSDAFGQGLLFQRDLSNGLWQPWIQIATTDKIDISLLNGWYNYDGGVTYATTQLEKNGNKVTGSGLIGHGTLTAGTTLFVLPHGYRPTKRQITKMTSIMGTTIILEVYTDGAVVFLFDVASTSSFSLNDFSITV